MSLVRQFYTEAARQIPVEAECDILVVGGGAAGHSAAIAAVRAGAPYASMSDGVTRANTTALVWRIGGHDGPLPQRYGIPPPLSRSRLGRRERKDRAVRLAVQRQAVLLPPELQNQGRLPAVRRPGQNPAARPALQTEGAVFVQAQPGSAGALPHQDRPAAAGGEGEEQQRG